MKSQPTALTSTPPITSALPAPRSLGYGWLLGLLATVAFSLATPIARSLLVGGADPSGLVTIRLIIATALHGLAIALSAPGLFRLDRRSVGISLLAGVTNGLGMLLYFLGLSRLSASITAMLLAMSPLVVLTLLVLRGEKLTRRHALRTGLALLGVYLLIGPGGAVDMGGVGLILLSVLAFSSQMVLLQWYLKSFDPRTVTFYVTAGMLLVVGVYWLSLGAPWHGLDTGGWIGLITLALVSTFLARLAMYAAVAYIGSRQMSLMTPLEILLTVIWAVLFLGERLTVAHLIGGALILVSALLAIQRLNLTWRRPRWRTWFRS